MKAMRDRPQEKTARILLLLASDLIAEIQKKIEVYGDLPVHLMHGADGSYQSLDQVWVHEIPSEFLVPQSQEFREGHSQKGIVFVWQF